MRATRHMRRYENIAMTCITLLLSVCGDTPARRAAGAGPHEVQRAAWLEWK